MLSANPQRVELSGGATTNFNIIEGDLFAFQGEYAWFEIGTIVDASFFDLTASYVGTKAFDTFLPFKVVRDFTQTYEFPELAPGDIDIRNVYTLSMRKIDAAIRRNILAEFSFQGVITAGAKPFKWFPPIEGTATAVVSKVAISLGTTPAGASMIVDVNKNGATIFQDPSHRPVIAAGGIFGLSTYSGAVLSPSDYLTVDVDQVGSVTPGSDLVVQVRF